MMHLIGSAPLPSGKLEDAVPGPGEALARLEGLPHRVLLESRGKGGRFSFLAAEPRLVVAVDGSGFRTSGILAPDIRPGFDGHRKEPDPFRLLERILARVGVRPSSDGPFPFPGGIVGFLGYEAAWVLERLPDPAADDVGMPDAWFGVYDWALVWDREESSCRLMSTLLPGLDPDDLRARTAQVAERLGAGSPEVSPSPPERLEFHSSLERERFMAGVERIRAYIRAGDLFQANLTRRITVESTLTGEELYRRMARESPAPYGAFMDLGDGEVVSASPEAFLSLRGRRVETRPIKGTAPRNPDPDEDRRLGEGLLASEKDRAENVMIVDLLRNDLSRVCEDGSVEVPELLALESHPTVHHLVSAVRGRLRRDAGPVDLLRATFPGGSITGAPKIRAMEVLRELEPVRRGVYTGALGVVGFGGDMELSIPIRTAVCRGGRIHYGTGGGITLASDPAREWEETEDKARAFVRAVQGNGPRGARERRARE